MELTFPGPELTFTGPPDIAADIDSMKRQDRMDMIFGEITALREAQVAQGVLTGPGVAVVDAVAVAEDLLASCQEGGDMDKVSRALIGAATAILAGIELLNNGQPWSFDDGDCDDE